MSQPVPQTTRPGRSQRPRWRHLLVLFGAAGLLAVAGLYAAVWWQEGPIREATAQLEEGDPHKALTTVDRFLGDFPMHGGAMSLRGRILVALGRPARAVEIFERFGGSTPQETHAWAQALLRLERWSEALPLLEHLTTTDVDRADVLHELSACRAKIGNADGAIAAAEAFAELPGCEARGNLLLGTLHNKRGNLKQTAAAWGTVLKHAPEAEGLQVPPADFFLQYGEVLQSTGDSRLAADLAGRSLAISPQAAAYVLLGNARASLGEQPAAEKAFKDALQLDVNQAEARTGLAQLALSSGDAATALEWLSVLESSDEMSSQVAFLFQQVTTRLGDTEIAKKWRTKADELRNAERSRDTALQVLRDVPDSNWAKVLRAYQFAEKGNWSEAELIITPIAASAKDQPFIQQLHKAVLEHSELPSLDLLPTKRF